MAPQRVAQILELTLLAPDIQEAVLFLESEDGVEPVSERVLREVDGQAGWAARGLERGQLGASDKLRRTSRA
jgi:hypothetical protein